MESRVILFLENWHDGLVGWGKVQLKFNGCCTAKHYPFYVSAVLLMNDCSVSISLDVYNFLIPIYPAINN